MRVLQVGKFYPPYRGGMETHLEDLCQELAKSVDIRVVVASGRRRSVIERIRDVEVERVATLGTVAGTPLCPAMPRRIRAGQADLFHVHLPNPMAVAAVLASRRPVPLVATYQSDIIRQRLWALLLSPLHERFLRRCSALITHSTGYLESSPVLRRHRARCRVIPHGVPPERFAAPSAAVVREIRARFGGPLLLAAGRLVYYKGFGVLLQAMLDLHATLLLAGEGPLRWRLQEQARTLGVGGRVRFLGEVEDLVPYYHACDVFVLPSVERSEAFGLVQLEAMACAKPVVNTQLASGVPFVSRDGESGITVPPRNPGALAAAIRRLLGDAGLRRAYGQAGRRRVEAEFTAERMAQSTLEVYSEVLAGAPSIVRRICKDAQRLPTRAVRD